MTAIRRWARLACLLAMIVVPLGAYVRLSDAGLGCPDWPGCYGHLAVPDQPHEQAAAARAFPGLPLDAGKAAKEMLHRYLAGGLGFMIAGVAWLDWRRARRRGEAGWRASQTLVLVVTVMFLQRHFEDVTRQMTSGMAHEVALVAERIMDAYRRLGELEQGIQLLRSYLDKYPSLDLLDALFQWELQKEGPQVAYQLVRDELRRNPTLLGLDKLLEAALLTAPAEQRTDIELVKSLVHGHTRRVARYRCDTCGFKARQFYWRCPACGGWETYPPKRTEEFDLVP